jgi:lipopolysaccharide/colanic/teichoic acid biosynthesis glycosyltransferase
MSERSLALKRGFDVVAASVGLVVTSPLLLVLAILVKVDSRGPVLFRQERVGRHGRTFRIHKFRTMRTQPVGAAGLSITTSHDPRITRVGAWLRATKLDELPQLVDVVVGDMSLVGPRPEVPRYVEQWPPDRRAVILSVRPGITDPASILLRDESSELALAADPETYYVDSLLPRKTELYVRYVQERSMVGDLRLIARTIGAVARH